MAAHSMEVTGSASLLLTQMFPKHHSGSRHSRGRQYCYKSAVKWYPCESPLMVFLSILNDHNIALVSPGTCWRSTLKYFTQLPGPLWETLLEKQLGPENHLWVGSWVGFAQPGPWFCGRASFKLVIAHLAYYASIYSCFHNYQFCFVIATPFLTDFTRYRSPGPVGISILPPALPALQQWPCASWVRARVLLRPCFSWIQITKIKSSAGSMLSQSVYVFMCSSNLPGLHRS